MSYYQRMSKLEQGLIPGALRHNNALMRNGREGDYLIKYMATGAYISYLYVENDGWISTGVRRNAAWFKKEELPEILKVFPKGFKVVKLSKNRH